MPSKQKKRRKNLTAASARAPGPVSSSSNFSRSGPMAQPYAATAGPLANGHADAAYHPAFSSFSAPPMTPTFPLPGLTSFGPPMNGQYQASVQTPITPHFPQVPGLLTSGNSDLEKLERLKREILEGQNPIYKAVPQPDFLASLYLGRSSQAQSTVPAHPEQVAVQTPPQAAEPAQNPAVENKSPEVDQTTATTEEGKTDKVDTAEPAKVVADTNSVSYTTATDSQDTPPPQNARGAIILDEIARFRANATSQSAASHVSAAPSNANGSIDPLRHQFQQDNKPSVRTASDYKITGHNGFNGSSGDSSRRPDSFVSDVRNGSRPGEYWDSKNYGSRFDHESIVQRDIRDRDHDGHPDQRYNDSRYENNSSRDRQPSFSTTREQHTQDYRGPDERVESRSPVVPSHISETVRSLTERLANGVGNDSISMRTGAITAAEASAHYPLAGSPASAVGHPSSLGMSGDFPARSVSGDERRHPAHDDHSHAFVNDRSRQPPRDDLPLHYPPSTSDRSPMNSAPHAVLSPGSLRGRATPLEERIGNKVPLEERISSPSSEAKARALQERISDPQPHAGYDRPLPPPAFNHSPQAAPHDTRPLSARPVRPADENNMIVSPASAHFQGRPDERLHQRVPSYGTYPHETPEPRSASVAPYNHNELQDRRPSDFRSHEKEPIVVYERPTYRERNGGPQDERSRPTLESREWRERERAVYPPPPPSRASHLTPEVERYSSHPPDAREWTPNDRGYRAPETNWDAQRTPPPREGDRSRYPDVRGEYERRPPAGAAPPPRSWDRSDAPLSRPRPAPEVFPPPPPHERERYPPPPPPEYYDNPRVRARSPSPTRRGGAPVGDLRPAKRVRDEGSFYDERRPMAYPGPGYASRPPSPPPPPPPVGGYYEGGRAAYPPPREAHPPPYVTRGDEYYDRRPSDAMPLPLRNGPPASYPNRAVYSRPDRDDRRYNMPPPRTA